MPRKFITVLGLLFMPSLNRAQADFPIRDIVLDVHGTSLQYRAGFRNETKKIGSRADVAAHYIQFLAYLHHTQKYRISLMSRGSFAQNSDFAKYIEAQIPGFLFYQIITPDHPESARREGFNANGKDLREVDPKIAANLENAVLIDDSERNRFVGQESNFVLLPVRTLRRQSFPWLLGVLLRAEARISAADHTISFSDAVHEILMETSEVDPRPLIHQGYQALRKSMKEIPTFGSLPFSHDSDDEAEIAPKSGNLVIKILRKCRDFFGVQ